MPYGDCIVQIWDEAPALAADIDKMLTGLKMQIFTRTADAA